MSSEHLPARAATIAPQLLSDWLAALEQRHLANLTLSEVGRALRALSSNYIQRRERLQRRTAFDTAGKRAAYALYYSPLHLLTVQSIAAALRLGERPPTSVLDLGCGAGAAGAAWGAFVASVAPPAGVIGVDEHPWAIEEAAFTYNSFGIPARVRRADVARFSLPPGVDAVCAGWLINELDDSSRATVLATLLDAARRGTQLLVVEPIARRLSPWWPQWVDTLAPFDARADEWRFGAVLPVLLQRLDRAAGLRHDELTARSIYVPPGRGTMRAGLTQATGTSRAREKRPRSAA